MLPNKNIYTDENYSYLNGKPNKTCFDYLLMAEFNFDVHFNRPEEYKRLQQLAKQHIADETDEKYVFIFQRSEINKYRIIKIKELLKQEREPVKLSLLYKELYRLNRAIGKNKRNYLVKAISMGDNYAISLSITGLEDLYKKAIMAKSHGSVYAYKILANLFNTFHKYFIGDLVFPDKNLDFYYELSNYYYNKVFSYFPDDNLYKIYNASLQLQKGDYNSFLLLEHFAENGDNYERDEACEALGQYYHVIKKDYTMACFYYNMVNNISYKCAYAFLTIIDPESEKCRVPNEEKAIEILEKIGVLDKKRAARLVKYYLKNNNIAKALRIMENYGKPCREFQPFTKKISTIIFCCRQLKLGELITTKILESL